MADFKLTGIETDNFYSYGETGFSFTTKTELDAYKAAYKYQGCKRAVVTEAPNVDGWLVQIYTLEAEVVKEEEDGVVEVLCINPLKPYKEIKGRSKLPRWISEEIKGASARIGKGSCYNSLEAVLNDEEDGYKALRLVEWERDANGASTIRAIREYNTKDLDKDFLIKFFDDNGDK